MQSSHSVSSERSPAVKAVVPGSRSASRSAPARLATARQLTTSGLESVAETTQMIVSELVTNAAVHTPGPVRPRLIRPQVLAVEVGDRDNNVPRIRRAGVSGEGGRGLSLVARLGRRWGTRLAPEGKLVWVEQELPLSASRERHDGTH